MSRQSSALPNDRHPVATTQQEAHRPSQLNLGVPPVHDPLLRSRPITVVYLHGRPVSVDVTADVDALGSVVVWVELDAEWRWGVAARYVVAGSTEAECTGGVFSWRLSWERRRGGQREMGNALNTKRSPTTLSTL
jgi:hypothetical protein